MEVILKQDVQNIGQKDKIVNVKNGYAWNFLIPKGIAVAATVTAKKIHAENLKQKAFKEERVKSEAIELAKKLENKQIKVGAKTSTTGKIFGSVNNIQIAEALAKKGFDIDRKLITIVDEDHIKEVGQYKAVIKLHRDVHVEIPFEVVSE
jgi:large subunit ribosomal protein L9